MFFIPGAGKPLAPFLVKLKAVFGGNVLVTAPKHFHGLVPELNHNGVFDTVTSSSGVRTTIDRMASVSVVEGVGLFRAALPTFDVVGPPLLPVELDGPSETGKPALPPPPPPPQLTSASAVSTAAT